MYIRLLSILQISILRERLNYYCVKNKFKLDNPLTIINES